MFQTNVLIETILRTTKAEDSISISIRRIADSDASELVYFHGSRLRPVPIEPLSRTALSAGPQWTGTIQIGDARWTMIAVPIPGGPGTAVHSGAWIALIFCLFVSGIIVAYIWLTGRHGQRLQIANAQLDHTLGTLNIVNDELSAALNNMAQGFIMFDSAGKDHGLQRALHRYVWIVSRYREARVLVHGASSASSRARQFES